MATEKHPARNPELPVDDKAVELARERLAPPSPPPGADERRRGVRASDDRAASKMRDTGRPGERINETPALKLDEKPSRSADEPPPVGKPSLPKTFDPNAFYEVQLLKAFDHAGRRLRPGRSHRLKGTVAEANRESLYGATKAT
jgi:hypothetical protein